MIDRPVRLTLKEHQMKNEEWHYFDDKTQFIPAECYDELLQRLRDAETALRFYGSHSTWSPINFLSGSDILRDDLSETSWSRFTPGTRARTYFDKYRGDK